MSKLYYFSKSTLQYVEVKQSNAKFYLLIGFLSLICIFSLFGAISFFSDVLFGPQDLTALKKENKLLRSKIKETTKVINTFNYELDKLYGMNKELRIAANLRPISEDAAKLGTGGALFSSVLSFKNDNQLASVFTLIDEVSKKINFEKYNNKEISDKLEKNSILFESLPAIRPTGSHFLTSGFGMRRHPILHITRMHEGIDFNTDIGSPVYATGNGKIDFVGTKGGYGLTVEIDHGFGYRTVYAHLSEVDVKENTKVKRGMVIAKSGNSGISTGPHLHYEVHHNGVSLDPLNFFFDDYSF